MWKVLEKGAQLPIRIITELSLSRVRHQERILYKEQIPCCDIPPHDKYVSKFPQPQLLPGQLSIRVDDLQKFHREGGTLEGDRATRRVKRHSCDS